MRLQRIMERQQLIYLPTVLPVTVKRDWRAAKAWLYRELTGGTTDGF